MRCPASIGANKKPCLLRGKQGLEKFVLYTFLKPAHLQPSQAFDRLFDTIRRGQTKAEHAIRARPVMARRGDDHGLRPIRGHVRASFHFVRAVCSQPAFEMQLISFNIANLKFSYPDASRSHMSSFSPPYCGSVIKRSPNCGGRPPHWSRLGLSSGYRTHPVQPKRRRVPAVQGRPRSRLATTKRPSRNRQAISRWRFGRRRIRLPRKQPAGLNIPAQSLSWRERLAVRPWTSSRKSRR